MAENTPNPPGGAVPPKAGDSKKIQPRKETVRIQLPPKPTASATVRLPSLPAGGGGAASSTVRLPAMPAGAGRPAAPAAARPAAAPDAPTVAMPTADEADPTAPTGNLPSSGAASPKKAATKTAARQPVGASHGRPAAVMAPVPVAAATNTVDVVFGVAAALIALGVAGYLFYIGATDIGI